MNAALQWQLLRELGVDLRDQLGRCTPGERVRRTIGVLHEARAVLAAMPEPEAIAARELLDAVQGGIGGLRE